MPLNPSHFSGPDPNTVPYFRNDTIPSLNKTNNPSTLDRAESHKNSSHYSGDNARSIAFPDSTPDYHQRSKRVKGLLNIDLNDDIWEHSDREIEKAVRCRVTEKFNADPKFLKVTVDRNKGKICYESSYYIQAAGLKKEDISGVPWSKLQHGAYFKFGESSFY
jgi:hypothetical protein